MTQQVQTWDEVRSDKEFKSILIGNGASVAVWHGFKYPSLFEIASTTNEHHLLGDADTALFVKLGTRNFEHVLASLATAIWVAEAIGIQVPEFIEHRERIRLALVEAVRSTHILWETLTEGELDRLEAIGNELRKYHWVYSTNYDLLVYWSVMSGQPERRHKDFFWGSAFDPGNTSLVDGSRAVLYLHGALHLLRTQDGFTRKQVATSDRNLLERFSEAWEEGATPLFISEGTAEDKRAAIGRSPYLSFAYRKLTKTPGPLCIFGHSLSDSDKHLVQAIGQASIDTIAISTLPEPTRTNDLKRTQALFPRAKVVFFDARTHPLGDPQLRVAANSG